nr:carboxymuconolactone decarboxylase family protein [uncultured Erwinia sp.]
MPHSLTRDDLAAIAPRFAAITDDILFGDIWQRSELSRRDRSLITVAALIAAGRHQQLPWHLDFAQKNGLSRSELTEVITHLAFYCGWPASVTALGHLHFPQE